MSSSNISKPFSKTQSWNVARRLGNTLKSMIERLESVYIQVKVSGSVRRKPYGCKVYISVKKRDNYNSKFDITLQVTDQFHSDIFFELCHLIEVNCLKLNREKHAHSSSDSDSSVLPQSSDSDKDSD